MAHTPEEFNEVVFNSLNDTKIMQKEWYKSRTMWLAIGQIFVAMFLEYYSANPGVQNLSWMLMLKSGVDMYIRLTHTSTQ